MKILITGDIHNEFGALNNLINHKRPDIVICCGDFGYWPDVSWAYPLSNIRLQGTQRILWCDGNHENHWAIRDRKTDELAPNIIYMPRGSTYTLPDGRTIMFMGGADSIDKMTRTVGYTWFPEEVITQKDLMNCPDEKIDIFITHTCSTELLPIMLENDGRKSNDPSNKALSELWNVYQPELWFFGHWHEYKEGNLKDTKWYSLSAPGFEDKWWMWLP